LNLDRRLSQTSSPRIYFIFIFETGSHPVTQGGLELVILLSRPGKSGTTDVSPMPGSHGGLVKMPLPVW
jgi:hypothetical protein